MASNNSNVTRLLDPAVFGPASTVGQVVSGSSAGGGASSDSTQQLAQQLQQLQSVAQSETETVQANTQAINQNTTQLGQGSGGSSALSKAGGALESVMGLGTGLSPLVSGIVSLFSGLFNAGGGQQSVPSTFLMPPAVNVNAGINEAAPTQPFGVDYAAGGQPRGATAGTSNSGPGSTQITVQVQAMDSQSFLDHSDDIAQAVRQAMLQSSVLNDVIREV
jgi:hypothetical protein